MRLFINRKKCLLLIDEFIIKTGESSLDGGDDNCYTEKREGGMIFFLY